MSKCCDKGPIVGPIVPFNFWTAFTPVVPDVYKEAISPQQQIHDMCCMLHKLVCYSDMLASELNIDKDKLQELSDTFDKFMDSGFFDYYAEQIAQWIRDNFNEIMKQILNQGIFFGLTEDGYFCANVAYQLTFVLDTIASYSDENYGHLTITY